MERRQFALHNCKNGVLDLFHVIGGFHNISCIYYLRFNFVESNPGRFHKITTIQIYASSLLQTYLHNLIKLQTQSKTQLYHTIKKEGNIIHFILAAMLLTHTCPLLQMLQIYRLPRNYCSNYGIM